MKKNILIFIISFLAYNSYAQNGHSCKFGNFRSNQKTTDHNEVNYNCHPKNWVGSHKALVILVNFSNTTPVYQAESIDSLLNYPGYNNRGALASLRDYFLVNSYGKFDLSSTVVEWVQLDKESKYYAYSNDATSLGDNIDEFAPDALAKLEQRGFDFSAYDEDNDGIIDIYPTLIHQGQARNTSNNRNHIWPHQGLIDGVSYDGVLINGYFTSGEARMDNKIVGIRVLAHEMGHALGMPELYDTNPVFSELSWGLGAIGNMSHVIKEAHPVNFSAWTKIQMGWTEPIIVDKNTEELAIPSAYDNEAIYMIREGFNDHEYLLLENRTKTGFDSILPGPGLAVYHVDDTRWDCVETNASTNNANRDHLHVKLLEADGNNDLYMINSETQNKKIEADDLFPGTANNTLLNTSTNPAIKSYYDGFSPEVELSDIRMTGDTVIFNVQVKECAGTTASIALVGGQLETDEAVRVEWYLDGELIEGETSSRIIPSANGSYIAKTFDQYNCESSSEELEVILTSTNNYAGKSRFTAYPNPSEGKVWFDQKTDVSVYSLTGQLLLSSHGIKVDNFDLSSLESGTYILYLDNGTHTQVLRLK